MTKEEYNLSPHVCPQCGEPILATEKEKLSETLKRMFCSKECASSSRRVIKNCIVCGKTISKNAKKYCSIECQQQHIYRQYIEKWENGEENGMTPNNKETSRYVRRYLFETYNNQCARCGWSGINPVSGKTPLQIDHIDGDYRNNKKENLILLCPNCHSLTPTFGALNKGNGRDWRY